MFARKDVDFLNRIFEASIKGVLRLQYYILLLLVFFCPQIINANEVEQRVLVFYPQIREPFLKIFTDMVDGIENCFDGPVVRFPLPKQLTKTAVMARIKQNNIDVVIALGQRTYQTVIQYSDDYPVALGALKAIEIEAVKGISQAPSAAKILERLYIISNTTKNISVVHTSKNTSVINKANEIISQREGELFGYEVSSLQESAAAYQKILRNSRQGDAIWLMNNKTILDNALLKEILEIAWEKRLLVFSSRPGLEKRGAIFSVYPDSYVFGQRLGDYVSIMRGSPRTCQGMIFDDVKMGINERTLEHLGLALNREQRDGLNLLLPSN